MENSSSYRLLKALSQSMKSVDGLCAVDRLLAYSSAMKVAMPFMMNQLLQAEGISSCEQVDNLTEEICQGFTKLHLEIMEITDHDCQEEKVDEVQPAAGNQPNVLEPMPAWEDSEKSGTEEDDAPETNGTPGGPSSETPTSTW